MRKRLLVAVLGMCGLVVGPAYPQSQPSNPTQQRVPDDRGQVPVFASPSWDAQRRPSTIAIEVALRRSTSRDAAPAEVARRSQGGKQAGIHRDRGRVRQSRSGDEVRSGVVTYVMWAITPEGRATNLGEVLLNEDKSKLNVTTELRHSASS